MKAIPPAVQILITAFQMMWSVPLCAQSEKGLTDRIIRELASENARVRYLAVRSLDPPGELPEPIVKILIDCLYDVKGEYPGNTVAGAAAEVLDSIGVACLHAGRATKALKATRRKELEDYVRKTSPSFRSPCKGGVTLHERCRSSPVSCGVHNRC